jgi:hypothetical protein
VLKVDKKSRENGRGKGGQNKRQQWQQQQQSPLLQTENAIASSTPEQEKDKEEVECFNCSETGPLCKSLSKCWCWGVANLLRDTSVYTTYPYHVYTSGETSEKFLPTQVLLVVKYYVAGHAV